jgi:hypothetical protein
MPIPQGNSEADRLARAVLSSGGSDAGAGPKQAMYNTADPVQALANLETMTIEAVFVLKDFHRHMDNPSWCDACGTWVRNFPLIAARSS